MTTTIKFSPFEWTARCWRWICSNGISVGRHSSPPQQLLNFVTQYVCVLARLAICSGLNSGAHLTIAQATSCAWLTGRLLSIKQLVLGELHKDFTQLHGDPLFTSEQTKPDQPTGQLG